MTRTTNTSKVAAALGRKGGKAKSTAKAAAARANGAKGGRPAVGGLLQYIPAILRAHVVDAYRDSDGIWVHFDESVYNRANESGTIHADSVRELREEARECAVVNGKPRAASWTVREVTERGAIEFSVPVGDGAEIIATLLPDNPEDEAVFAVHATWGDIGPLDGVDADLDTLAGRVSAALPRVGGWSYDRANGVIVQANS